MSLSRAATAHTPVGAMQTFYTVDGQDGGSGRNRDGHCDLADPKEPVPTWVTLSAVTPKLLTVLTSAAAPAADPHSSVQVFWAIGTVFEVTLAVFVMPSLGWRWLLLLSAVPLLIFAVLCFVGILYEISAFGMDPLLFAAFFIGRVCRKATKLPFPIIFLIRKCDKGTGPGVGTVWSTSFLQTNTAGMLFRETAGDGGGVPRSHHREKYP